jgi:hypothetical protein
MIAGVEEIFGLMTVVGCGIFLYLFFELSRLFVYKESLVYSSAF